MSHIIVDGTLNADGTLELDQKPILAPGRVRVMMQPLEPIASPPQETLLDYVLRSRKELEAKGSRFMKDGEVRAWVEELRADDDRIERAYRQA